MGAEYVLMLLLGHMVGDYVLQTEWMALNKNRKGSVWPGLSHAIVYTLCVTGLTGDHRWSWYAVVFLSHYPIDRWSLAEKWLKFIGGRTMEGFVYCGHHDIKVMESVVKGGILPPLPALAVAENYRILRGAFTALVYAAVDNTFHLLLMVAGWHLLQHWGL